MPRLAATEIHGRRDIGPTERKDELRLPEGLAIRPATSADVEAIAKVVAAAEMANDGVVDVHPNDVAQSLKLAEPHGQATVVVTDARNPDPIVAWASLVGDRAEVDVHPSYRGRGIGRALLGWSERRARASGSARVRQTVTNSDSAAGELFRANGYAVAHTSWILTIALGDEPPAVVIPAGIDLRAYRSSDDRAVHRLIDDAFSEWPGRDPVDFDRWAAHILEHGSFAPDLSRLAFEGDELVGVALSFDYDNADDGWIQQVATKRSHRNRGIARGLLQGAFAAFHAAGRRSVGLSTDSRTGALTLYERIGMRVGRSYTGWAKELT